jgi:metal-dependent amidase/aminoacylase/carboxypeptidase family protein
MPIAMPQPAQATAMKLIESILESQADIQQIRHDIHAHPELAFEEKRTAEVVAQKLAEWGIPVLRGLGATGVVGILKQGDSKRSLGLRADMDALPVQEITALRMPPAMPARCTPVATMAIPRCCWARRAIWRSIAILTAPFT